LAKLLAIAVSSWKPLNIDAEMLKKHDPFELLNYCSLFTRSMVLAFLVSGIFWVDDQILNFLVR